MKLKNLITSAMLLTSMGLTAVSHAALLNLTQGDPIIENGSGGVIAYDAATGVVSISGTPQLLTNADPFLFGEFVGATATGVREMTIQFKVAPDGSLVSGVNGADLVITGAVDVDFDGTVDYDGVLLEAEVTQFGFQDGGAAADRFDIRMNSVAGALAPLFNGRDLSISIASEIALDFPNAFNGSFTSDFSGLAKVSIGTTDQLVVAAACHINVEATCSVNGGSPKSTCGITKTKAIKYWKPKWHDFKGHKVCKSQYGTHGGATPSWMMSSPDYKTTPVKFAYVVTNTGTTTIQGLQVLDSFDTTVSGVPTSLAPGQSATLMRTEDLNDPLVNSIVVSGNSGGPVCMSQAAVTITEKVKDPEAEHDKSCKERSFWKKSFKSLFKHRDYSDDDEHCGCEKDRNGRYIRHNHD